MAQDAAEFEQRQSVRGDGSAQSNRGREQAPRHSCAGQNRFRTTAPTAKFRCGYSVFNKIDERKRQAAIEAESHPIEDDDAWKPKRRPDQIESRQSEVFDEDA
jgi:hypothetical protein